MTRRQVVQTGIVGTAAAALLRVPDAAAAGADRFRAAAGIRQREPHDGVQAGNEDEDEEAALQTHLMGHDSHDQRRAELSDVARSTEPAGD